jgi:MinD superfamily P-loop ATPase
MRDHLEDCNVAGSEGTLKHCQGKRQKRLCASLPICQQFMVMNATSAGEDVEFMIVPRMCQGKSYCDAISPVWTNLAWQTTAGRCECY